MRKVIESFNSDKAVFFIDLEDVDVSTLVTPQGNILLNEGIGEDRIDHGCIPENKVKRFFIDRQSDLQLVVEYLGFDERLIKHRLGLIRNEELAKSWITQVNSKYPPYSAH